MTIGEYSYYPRLAAAYVRGAWPVGVAQPDGLGAAFAKPLAELSEAEEQALIAAGLERHLKVQRFRKLALPPVYERVMASLRGIKPDSLIDIGNAYGLLLWKILDDFPFMTCAATDADARHVATAQAVYRGGVSNLRAAQAHPHELAAYTNEQFDVATSIDHWAEAPDPAQALAEICRVTKRFVILAVPMHLLGEAHLRQLFARQHIAHLKFEICEHRLLAIARK